MRNGQSVNNWMTKNWEKDKKWKEKEKEKEKKQQLFSFSQP